MSDAPCPFCRYDGPSPMLLDVGAAYLIEPINPVTPGHVLAIPTAHIESFVGLRSWEHEAVAQVLRLASVWTAERGGDWNMITSAGAAATQSVKHLHFHLVPRRQGDRLMLPWDGERKALEILNEAARVCKWDTKETPYFQATNVLLGQVALRERTSIGKVVESLDRDP